MKDHNFDGDVIYLFLNGLYTFMKYFHRFLLILTSSLIILSDISFLCSVTSKITMLLSAWLICYCLFIFLRSYLENYLMRKYNIYEILT